MLFKKKFNYLFITFSMAFASLLLTDSVNAQNQANDEAKVMVSETGVEYEVTGWDTRTVYDPTSYSYQYWETPIYSMTKTKKVYPVPVSDFDQPPVFTSECANADNPMACSNEALQNFIQSSNFRYPTSAKARYQEGIEYVTFTLDKDGNFVGRPSVLKKDEPCKGCSEKAVDIILDTKGKWQPAILDGEPVRVILTIPVRFELEESPVK